MPRARGEPENLGHLSHSQKGSMGEAVGGASHPSCAAKTARALVQKS